MGERRLTEGLKRGLTEGIERGLPEGPERGLAVGEHGLTQARVRVQNKGKDVGPHKGMDSAGGIFYSRSPLCMSLGCHFTRRRDKRRSYLQYIVEGQWRQLVDVPDSPRVVFSLSCRHLTCFIRKDS